MKKLIYIFAFVISTLTSCDKSNVEDGSLPDISVNTVRTDDVNRSIRPVILGERKENPFSLENMKIALDTLKKIVEQSDEPVFKANEIDGIELETTDLYVRLLPQDSIQYKQLMNDTTLTLFDFPLDYEIKQSGDYYQDPTLKKPFTWYYTTVKPGYIPPVGVKYEIIEKLFIAEHSEYYSEEPITYAENTQQAVRRNTNSQGIDTNIFNALCVISFKLTGNEKELKQDTSNILPANSNKSAIMKITIPNCTRYTVKIGFVKISWTSCDPYYFPDGKIKVNTPNGEVGVKGIKVRMWRWFTYADARTDSIGYYYCNKDKFNSVWIGNDIDYHIIFEGSNNSNIWTLSRSIFGAICLWTNYYGAGSHDPNGYTMTFDTNNDYWGKCVLNNAIFNYCDIAKIEGISLPPDNLDIANKTGLYSDSGAPLLNNHINWSLVYAYPNFWGVVAQFFADLLVGWAYPDLMLRYSGNLKDYYKITSIAWHELTHASQVNRMISEKGLLWASDYWSANVYQQASNTFKDYNGDGNNDGNPYGNKGDERWQIIALSEGWANYREQVLAIRYLGQTNYNATYNLFLVKYLKMFEELESIGCSFQNMEKSLCTYSISGFRDNLNEIYPSLKSQITIIISSRL